MGSSIHTVFSSKQSVESLGDAQMTVDTDSTRPSSQYLSQKKKRTLWNSGIYIYKDHFSGMFLWISTSDFKVVCELSTTRYQLSQNYLMK